MRKAEKRSGAIWNKAYQAVKHDRKNNLKQETVKNLIHAMAALFVLDVYYMETTVDLGKNLNAKQEFDSRFGSDIFSVSFADATVDITMGGDTSDKALSDEIKKAIPESIYILRFKLSSLESINKEVVESDKRIKAALKNNNEFKKYIEEGGKIEGQQAIGLAYRFLGDDYILRTEIFDGFGHALNNAQAEAVLVKKNPVYGAVE